MFSCFNTICRRCWPFIENLLQTAGENPLVDGTDSVVYPYPSSLFGNLTFNTMISDGDFWEIFRYRWCHKGGGFIRKATRDLALCPHRHTTKETPCELTARRPRCTSHQKSPPKNLTMLAPSSLTSGLQNCEKLFKYCLKYPKLYLP